MEELYTWKDPLFIGLWHGSWQASVLIGLVLLLQCLFGKRLSSGWRYNLWLLVVARLALPVTPESPLSIFNASIFDGMRFSRPGAQSFENLATPPIVSPVANKHRKDPSPLASQCPEMSSTSPQARSSSLLNSMFKPMLTWISSIWILGVLLQTVRICRQNVRFANHLKGRQPEVGSELVELLEECKGLMGIRHHITLLETPQVRSPALYGLFRPKLLLPEHLIVSFSREELRYVLLHELAHVKRSDMAVNWLMTVVQIMHWFNPLVWLAINRMRADRELACDALVLSQPNEPEAFNYGATLIRLLEGLNRPAPSPSLIGILQDRNQIQQRIRTIANFKTPSRRPAWAVLLIVGLGLVGLTDARTPKATLPVLGDDSGGNSPAKGQVPQKNEPSGIHVTGRVIDKKTTKPINDFSVVIRKRLGLKNGIWFIEYEPTTSEAVGSDGEFSLTLTNGIKSYDIEIRAEGYSFCRSGWRRLEDGDAGLLYSLAKSIPVEGVMRSRQSQPAKGMKVSLGKGAAQGVFPRTRATKGSYLGGTDRKAVDQFTSPANGQTIDWKSNNKPYFCITSTFPLAASPLILQSGRSSTIQNTTPDSYQPTVLVPETRDAKKTPPFLAQIGGAPSQFPAIRTQPAGARVRLNREGSAL